MEKTFWLERWEQNLIGFHQQDINRYLQEHWSYPGLEAGAEVLVPLCGKSRDMCWLGEQGYRVLGVELSRLAVEDFFRDNGLTPHEDQQGAFRRYAAQNITLLCGDFFDLGHSQLEQIQGVYDRAALIALPPAMRARYAAHLSALRPAPVSMLLVTIEYPQEQMNGPPFAVLEPEVRELFEPHWVVELLHQQDILAGESKFRDRGLTSLVEKIYRLERRPA